MAKKKRRVQAQPKKSPPNTSVPNPPPADPSGFETHYSENSFWSKVKKYALRAGHTVIEKAMILYYGLQCPKTPKWAKAAILAALGYFISPVDAVPDPIPVVGYVDDYGVLVAALAMVAATLCKKDIRKGKQKTREWVG